MSSSPFAELRHLAAIRQTDVGRKAVASTPWPFAVELDSHYVSLASACCQGWFATPEEGDFFFCHECQRELPLPLSLERDNAPWRDLRPFLEGLLTLTMEPLEAVLAASELEADLLLLRGHFFR